MSYSEGRREVTCGECSAHNHVIIAYTGDYRANERETARCYKCAAPVDNEKCLAIFTAETAAEAEAQLRAMQGR